MNQWFRMYHEVLDDPKVQKLSPEFFKHWINCLCLAARNDGFLPPISDISFALRLSETKTEECIQYLVKHGLIEKKAGWYQPHNWSVRQFKSDVSTERVRAFRKRFGNVSRNSSETVSETVNETDQIQNRADTEQTRAEPPIVPHRGTTVYSADFEVFWAAYPKKTGKGAAWSVFRRNGHPPVAELVQAVAALARTELWTKDGGQYIPNPATWLNQKRWDDEIPKTPEQLRMERYRAFEERKPS